MLCHVYVAAKAGWLGIILTQAGQVRCATLCLLAGGATQPRTGVNFLGGTQSKPSFRRYGAIASYGLPTFNEIPATGIFYLPALYRNAQAQREKHNWSRSLCPHAACIFIYHHYILWLRPTAPCSEVAPPVIDDGWGCLLRRPPEEDRGRCQARLGLSKVTWANIIATRYKTPLCATVVYPLSRLRQIPSALRDGSDRRLPCYGTPPVP